jgi:LmbE family N-acetylglucosaminyl deacetylase
MMLWIARALLLVVIAHGWCAMAAGRIRSVRPGAPRPGRLLLIVAHPDDELLFAPFLAPRCVRGGTSCAILVMTAGENGSCARPDGCGPDLATVRMAEMTLSAALLNATLEQWRLPDVMTGWDDRQSLVRQLRDRITSDRPDLILTFDPTHGTTGHPAHREIGALVVEAGARNFRFLETLARSEGDGFVLEKAAGTEAAYPAGSDWEYAVMIAEIHASQFTAAQVNSLRTLPVEQRMVWLTHPR